MLERAKMYGGQERIIDHNQAVRIDFLGASDEFFKVRDTT